MIQKINQIQKHKSKPNITLAIKIFELVRDIEYRIPLNEHESNNACHGKSWLLYNLLRAYGFNARLRACSFKWSKLKIPEEFKKYIVKDDGLHAYVEICLDSNDNNLNNKWILLDASFDSKLIKKLPVNIWDGQTDTKLQIVPIKIYNPKQSYKLLSEYKRDYISNRKLFQKLNKNYEKIRKM